MREVLCPVVVGRDEELAVLEQRLEGARGGRGGIVLLAGEAGIGKSRLAREAVAMAAGQGMRVLAGRASRGVAVAYRPFAEALLGALRAGRPPELAELRPFRPALGRLVPEWSGGAGLGDSGRSLAVAGPGLDDSPVVLAEAVLRLLTALTAGRGGLLVLEDLHWADPESLAVVEYLADNLGGEPVMCLGTVRSEEASAGLELARGLGARRAARVLTLPRLDVTAVAEMVAACLPSAPEALGEQVVRLADGVPFWSRSCWPRRGPAAGAPAGRAVRPCRAPSWRRSLGVSRRSATTPGRCWPRPRCSAAASTGASCPR
jgi:predicted ATPase